MPSETHELFRRDCAGRTLLDHITGKWGILVLTSLKDGPLRFHQVRALIDGVSDKMLTQTLRTFAADGLVERTVIPTSPPAVIYALTSLGAEAAHELDPFLRWVRRSVTVAVDRASE